MTARELWPTYAYVPGKTPRHEDNAFDRVRETANADLSPSELADCTAFRLGLRYLEAGFYWEAHEVFEPVWMAFPDPSEERRFVQGLIQIANGFLKIRMGRPKAAARLVVIAQNLMPKAGQGAVMGVDLCDTQHMIESLNAQCILHYNT